MRLRYHARMKASALLALLPLAALTACTSTVGSSGSPRAAEPAPYVPPDNQDGLVLYSAGVDAWFADPKDARLRAALDLVDERVAELPAELDEPELPADAILLALEMFASPMSLRAKVVENPAAPVQAQWTVESDSPERARDVAARFSALLAEHGVPSLGKNEAHAGMQTLPLGPFNAYHGVLGERRPSSFAVALGEVELEELDLGTLDLPAGVRPFLAWKVDYGQYAKALAMVVGSMMPPGAAEGGGTPATVNPFSALGLADTVVTGGVGHGKDRMYGAMRTLNYVPAARASDLLASGPLAEREIAIVPSDATRAAVGRMNQQYVAFRPVPYC